MTKQDEYSITKMLQDDDTVAGFRKLEEKRNSIAPVVMQYNIHRIHAYGSDTA